jgi:hypothetical protein
MKRFVYLILALPSTLYLLLPTREFYWDGVIFSLEIERSNGNLNDLFRANHLIYNLVGFFLFDAFNGQIRALFLLQILNGVLAGICLLTVYFILKEMTRSRDYSIVVAMLMAFSATWWRFASDANAYIPSILFLLVSYNLLLPTRKPRPLIVGLTHVAAILFHQLAVFFFPVAVAALWRQTRKWTSIICYAAVSFTLTAAAYTGAYHSISNAGSFWNWITTHSEDSHFTFSILKNIGASLLSNFRLFWGGKLVLLQFDAVTIFGIIGLIVSLGWLVKLRGELKTGFRELRGQINRTFLSENAPLVIWISIYVLFLLFWLPKNTFYRLFYLPPLILLAGILCHPWKRKFRHTLVLAVLVLCLWNFTFLIYPYSRVDNNEILTFALQHRSDWPKGTKIIFSEYHSNLWTISYFNPQVSWLGKTDYSEIVQLPTDVPLWLEGTAYDLISQKPEGRQWLAVHVDMSRSFIHRSRKNEFRFYRIISEG